MVKVHPRKTVFKIYLICAPSTSQLSEQIYDTIYYISYNLNQKMSFKNTKRLNRSISPLIEKNTTPDLQTKCISSLTQFPTSIPPLILIHITLIITLPLRNFHKALQHTTQNPEISTEMMTISTPPLLK